VATNGEMLLRRYEGKAAVLQLTDVQAAYLAGLWDGEGYIGISRRRRHSGRWNYSQHVSVGNTNFTLVARIVELLGEHAFVSSRKLPSGKTFFHIHIRRLLMVKLLRAIVPYLVAKRRQAEIVLHHRDLCENASKGQFPDEVLEHSYLEIRALNARKGRHL